MAFSLEQLTRSGCCCTACPMTCQVRCRISDLGQGSGYVLAPVHCIQPDVPPENVCAMFDEAKKVGRYPLAQ